MDMIQSNTAETEKRPVLVWCAGIFLFASALLPFLSIMADEARRNHFLSQSVFQYLVVFPVPILTLAGAVGLVTLRKYAFSVLAVAFILDIMKTFYLFGFTNYIAQIRNPLLDIPRIVVLWVIFVFIILYARLLMKKGVLQ